MNNDDEIAVVIKKKSWSWSAKYDIEEQWKENATSYKVEYSWSGSGFTIEVSLLRIQKAMKLHAPIAFEWNLAKQSQ